MFDIKWIRDNPDAFDAGLRKRGIAPGGEVKFAAELIALDDERRQIITALQDYQAQRNAASKEIGKAKAAKDEDKARALMAEVADLKDALEKGDKDQKAADKALHDALSVIPNLPADDVPEGADEKGNKEIRKVGDAAEARLDQQAAAALRDRRGAGADGLRDGGQAVGRALRGAQGADGAAGAGAGGVHARYSHGAGEGRHRRLHGDRAADDGARRGDVRHGAVAEVCG